MTRIDRTMAPLPQPTAAPAARPCKAFTLLSPETPPSAPPPPAPLPAGPLSASASASAPTRALTRLLEDERKVDAGLRAAMAGQKLDAQQLLVLQAQVMQYSMAVDVASRLVDKATNAVRTIMQTQV